MNPVLLSEIWKPIPGWSCYEASNLGQVRRLAGWTTGNKRGRRWIASHILIPCEPRACVGLYQDGKKLISCVGNFVQMAFAGLPKKGQWLRHLDDDPWNNVKSNLAWGTRLQNAKDAINNGRYRRGIKHHKAKLTEQLVLQIRQEYKPHTRGFGCGVLSKKYGITHSNILAIVQRKIWTHI